MKFKKKSGFTLVELIVVIAIIGILSAIAIPKFDKYIVEARAKSNIANARTIYTAVMAYNMDHLNKPYVSYLDHSSGELRMQPDKIPAHVMIYKSFMSEYLPDSIKFVMLPMDIGDDDLYCISSFPEQPLGTTFSSNDTIGIGYFEPRMPITSVESMNTLPRDMYYSGTSFVDGRAVVLTIFRVSGEDFFNPALYPTVEEYIQEYNDYMKNKETN